MASTTPTYSFQAKIASRGYHVFKETTWTEAKVDVKIEIDTNKKSINIDPYARAIRAKNHFFDIWKTVGHIPREISRHVFFFVKEEGGGGGVLLPGLFYRQNTDLLLYQQVGWKYR